ncbi:outer-membrane lipoprotein carrier protein LolA [uncultured Cardiobacterium sp.]|uniref:LolA family protein n=1 Tax=uncultured Cardiobacterium sp. TaxID=417619 RepID=UPI002634C73D|nr:outer-membrane lipoprotein carrier protein LolA [uncultured Cardiobacterium sp.]
MKKTLLLSLTIALALPAYSQQAATKSADNAAAAKQAATNSLYQRRPAAEKKPAETAAKPADKPAAAATNTGSGNALDTFMKGTKDLQANFTQTVYNKRGEETSKGQMWVAKPGKFYWDYQSPNPQKIISNGTKVYHYDIDLEQISIRGRDELVGDVAVELLNGDDNISRNYNIDRVVKNLTPPRLQKWVGNGVTYRLKPKTRQEEYDALWVILDGNSISAVMIDGGSSQTILNFTNMKRNVGIPASQFEFTPPKGVDVVGK